MNKPSVEMPERKPQVDTDHFAVKPQHDLVPAWPKFASSPVVMHFIDPTARVHPTAKVWHFAVLLSGVTVHEGVSIGAHAEVGRGSTIGARSRIGSGVFLPPDSVVGEGVFIGPHVTFTDDKHPKVPAPHDPPYHAQPPVIEDGAAIGAGTVVLPGVRIGANARIGAGAIVTRDVEPGAMVRGEPSRVRDMPAEWGACIAGRAANG